MQKLPVPPVALLLEYLFLSFFTNFDLVFANEDMSSLLLGYSLEVAEKNYE